jgi:hypothetical protein
MGKMKKTYYMVTSNVAVGNGVCNSTQFYDEVPTYEEIQKNTYHTAINAGFEPRGSVVIFVYQRISEEEYLALLPKPVETKEENAESAE